MRWGVADQALSSAGNFGLSFVLARTLSHEGFGAFALVWSTYVLAFGMSRALISEPFTIRYGRGTEPADPEAQGLATGASLLLGALLSLVCVAVAAALGGQIREAFLALAAVLPLLLLQDCLRYLFFAVGRARAAVINDLVWVLLLAAGLDITLSMQARSLRALLFAWGVAGSLAALFGLAQARVVPRVRRGFRWFVLHRELSLPYLGELVATTGATQASFYGVGLIASVVAVGTLRAGQVVMGPLAVVFLGVSMVGLPLGVRRAEHPAALDRLVATVSWGLVGASLAWATLVLTLPDGVGRALLAHAWPEARSVLLPLAVGNAATGLLTGPLIGLRSLAAARGSLRVRVLAAPITIAAVFSGAFLGAAVGAAWGLSAALWATSALWWLAYWRGRRTLGLSERAREAP